MVKRHDSGTIRFGQNLSLVVPRVNSRFLCALLGTGFFSLGSALAYAEPAQVTGRLNNRLSDNIRQSEDNEQTDVESRVSVQVDHRTDPARCLSDLSANLGVGVYLDDTYDPELYTNINWLGACDITERMTWEVRNSTRNVQQNSRGSNTPDNTTTRNTFSTGPRYTINLGQVDMIDLSATYEDTRYFDEDDQDEFDEDGNSLRDNNDDDSNSVRGSIAWNHLFSQTLSGGLRLAAEEVEYDSGRDTSTQTLTGFFSQRFVTTTIGGSLGVTRLETETDQTTQESDGWVGDFSITREITESSTVYANVRRELTDRQQDYDVMFNGAVFSIEQSTPVEVTALRTGFLSQFSDASMLDISFVADRSRNLATDDNDDRLALQGNYIRPIGSVWEASLAASLAHLSYDDDGTSDQLASVSAGLTYQLTRRFDIDGRVGHNRRSSDIRQREYVENWISLGVEYRFWQ